MFDYRRTPNLVYLRVGTLEIVFNGKLYREALGHGYLSFYRMVG